MEWTRNDWTEVHSELVEAQRDLTRALGMLNCATDTADFHGVLRERHEFDEGLLGLRDMVFDAVTAVRKFRDTWRPEGFTNE
jgi:hypothetical protein